MPTVPAPRALRRPRRRTHHGHTFDDPYAWLRDASNLRVIAHLEAENAHTLDVTAHTEPLAQRIYDEISARTLQTDLTVADFVTHSGGDTWWYYARTTEGSDYPTYCRAPATTRDDLPDPEATVIGEHVLLDGNAEAAGHGFFSIGEFSVSPDGRRLLWSRDTVGDEQYTLFIRDVATGEDLDDTAAPVSGACWFGDDRVVYALLDNAWRPHRIVLHHVGGPSEADRVLWDEPDERFWLGAGESRDGRWLVMVAASKASTEFRLLATDAPLGAPWTVAERRPDLEYDVEVAGDRLLILHNRDAVDFALAEAPLQAGHPDDWRTVIGGQDGTRLLGVDAYASHIVVGLRREGVPRVYVAPRDLRGNVLLGRDLPVTATVGSPGLTSMAADDDDGYDADRIRIVVESFTDPAVVVDHVLATGVETVLRRRPVRPDPDGVAYNPASYVSRRVWASAEDGTRVPMSLVHRADVTLPAPTLLYGYGAYETSLDPAFSIPRLSVLDRGVILAYAHVRGGGELGRSWYDAGKLTLKTTSFTDLVACARHLTAVGITTADRLAVRGFSAGGLLVGAAVTLAPDAFRAAHVGVGFVDPLTSMLDPTLPLTVTEYDEWGDPLSDESVYSVMHDYSPYENVSAVRYPAILATVSLNDARVSFGESAKWVAALRATATNQADRPILLRTDMGAGHGGASSRYAAWRDEAFELAWLLDQLDATEPVVRLP